MWTRIPYSARIGLPVRQYVMGAAEAARKPILPHGKIRTEKNGKNSTERYGIPNFRRFRKSLATSTLEGTLDGRIPKKGMRCWWAETHSKTAQAAELQATASVSVFITNNRSYLTRSISDTAQKLSPCPDSHNLHVSMSRSYSS